MTEGGLCKNGDGKPVHCKDECQACYRRTQRRARGLQKPGPKPDASKPFSRYNPVSSHHLKRIQCEHGHKWVEGSYKLRSDGKRVCLVCVEDNRPTHCPAGHDYAIHGWSSEKWPSTQCRECGRIRQIAQRLKAKYGLTVEQFESMLLAQENRCLLCVEAFDFTKHNGACVDHDHNCCKGEKTCGRCIRGILCGDCNKKLHDDVVWHLRAIEYLESYRLARKLKEAS